MSRDHVEYLGIDGKIMLKLILEEIGWEGMDWIKLVQGRDKCKAFVNK